LGVALNQCISRASGITRKWYRGKIAAAMIVAATTRDPSRTIVCQSSGYSVVNRR
jgi:hypothetical protein